MEAKRAFVNMVKIYLQNYNLDSQYLLKYQWTSPKYLNVPPKKS